MGAPARTLAALTALLLSGPAVCADTASTVTVLDNARARVERVTLQPNQANRTDARRRPELFVFIHGGTLEDAGGRRTRWEDGRAWWRPAAAGPSVWKNVGPTPIEWVAVDVKSQPVKHDSPAVYLDYPNIPGEDLLTNDWLVVQRFQVQPDQWEGVHAHAPNMMWIHIHGGQWAARTATEAEHPYPHRSPDGSVGWMDPIALSVGHESGNSGDAPIDLIWVTFRR